MDSSFGSGSSIDSPNTAEWKRYRHCTGIYTVEEKNFLVRKGFMKLDENGEYQELSTIIDSDFGEMSDEDDYGENSSIIPDAEIEDVSPEDVAEEQIRKSIHNNSAVGQEEMEDPVVEEDANSSYHNTSVGTPGIADICPLNMSATHNSTGTPRADISPVNAVDDDIISLTHNSSAGAPGIDNMSPLNLVEDDVAICMNRSTCTDAPVFGIADMSPANIVEEEEGSNNNTTNSFPDISLDEISDSSFNLDLADDAAMNEKQAHDDSFRTCNSVGTTVSFSSCKDSKEEPPKSPEDLDDTITLMERLLAMADEQEAKELKDAENNVSLDEAGESFRTMFRTPMKSQPPSATFNATPGDADGESFRAIFQTPTKTPQYSSVRTDLDSPHETAESFRSMLQTLARASPSSMKSSYDTTHDLPSPSLFATPMAPPVRRSKRISLTSMDEHVIQSSPKGRGKNSPLTPSTGHIRTPPARIASPKSPSGLSSLRPPTVEKVNKLPPHPKPAIMVHRLASILDSPAGRPSRIQPIPATKNNPPSRLQKTPEKKLSSNNGHPITSPVANYIYSLPPPTQIKRMAPPPILPNQMSPKSRPDSRDEPVMERSRIPKPKSSLPVQYLGTLTESGDNVRKGKGSEPTGNIFGFQGNMQKNFTPTHYVGSDGVRSVGTPRTVGGPTYPPRYQNAQGITPVSHRHLGKRDSKNASMVAEANVERKFCPERFGFRYKPQQ